MTDRIRPSLPSVTPPAAPATATGRASGASRAPQASEGPSFADALRDAASSLSAGQTRIDRAIRRGTRGETDPGHLLALQAGVYRYTQELELASKLVDKATGALKQTLQSQQ